MTRPTPTRARPSILLVLTAALATVPTLAAAAAAPPISEPARRALRERAAQAIERREQARKGGISLAAVHRELILLADSLEVAGLDSLASRLARHAGSVSNRLGHNDVAEAELNRAAQLARRVGDQEDETDARLMIARMVMQKRPEDAIRDFEALAPWYLRHRQYSRLSSLRQDQSRCYGVLGRWSDALRVAQESMRLARLANDRQALGYAFSSQSQIYHQLRREREALELADSAVALGRATGIGQILAQGLTARSNALRGLGRRDEALAPLDEALALDERRNDRRHGARTRLLKGNLFFELGRFDECRQQSLSLADESATSGDSLMELRARTLAALAMVSEKRWAEADALTAALLRRYESMRGEQEDEESQAGLFLRGGEVYATRARMFLETGKVEQAWATVERGRAGVLEARLGGGSGTPSLARLQKRLGAARAALVQYNDPQRNPLAVFVVTGSSVRARTLGSHAAEDDAKAALLLMASGAKDAVCRPPLERLSAALLAGVPEMIPAGVERVFIVPPSDLGGLPFEALPLPGTATTRLGDRWAVSYLPSAEALALLEDMPDQGRGMAVFADPELPRASWFSGLLPQRFRGLIGVPLPGSRAEARKVAIPGSLVLTGAQATRARLFSPEVAGRAVLHFATHALVDAMQPDSSGLLLAGRDGMVGASEVGRLRLAADLVTLSGCRTAGGEMFLGEGTFGLARAFLLAGSRSVVTSLWDVEDRAAARFMTLFYEGLRSGLPRDLSLGRARAEMARRGYPLRDRTAFVLTGVGDLPVAVMAAAGPPAPGRSIAGGARGPGR